MSVTANQLISGLIHTIQDSYILEVIRYFFSYPCSFKSVKAQNLLQIPATLLLDLSSGMIMIFWCRSSRESVIQSLCYMLLLFLNFTHLVRRALVLSYTSFFMRYFHSKRESLDRPFLFYHENIYWYKPEKLLSLALMVFFTIIWTFAKCSSEFVVFYYSQISC